MFLFGTIFNSLILQNLLNS